MLVCHFQYLTAIHLPRLGLSPPSSLTQGRTSRALVCRSQGSSVSPQVFSNLNTETWAARMPTIRGSTQTSIRALLPSPCPPLRTPTRLRFGPTKTPRSSPRSLQVALEPPSRLTILTLLRLRFTPIHKLSTTANMPMIPQASRTGRQTAAMHRRGHLLVLLPPICPTLATRKAAQKRSSDSAISSQFISFPFSLSHRRFLFRQRD
jgi:hypothetical protein